MPGSLNWRSKHGRKMFTRCGLGAACWLRDGFDLGKRRRRSSTPAVVPGAAPALAKAGVGGFISTILICWTAKRGVCGTCIDFQHETSCSFTTWSARSILSWNSGSVITSTLSHAVSYGLAHCGGRHTIVERSSSLEVSSLPWFVPAINWMHPRANFIPAWHFSLGARARRRMAKWVLAPPRWATHFPVVKRTVLSDSKPLIFCCISGFLCHYSFAWASLRQRKQLQIALSKTRAAKLSWCWCDACRWMC